MAKTFQFKFVNGDDVQPEATGAKQRTVAQLINFLRGLVGARRVACTVTEQTDMVSASGTVALASVSGTVAIVINGVTSSVTAGGGDAATATALAAKINEGGDTPNNLVSKHVTASASSSTVTITAIAPGHPGNAITLTATAGGGTATASGARLTGGTSTDTSLAFG